MACRSASDRSRSASTASSGSIAVSRPAACSGRTSRSSASSSSGSISSSASAAVSLSSRDSRSCRAGRPRSSSRSARSAGAIRRSCSSLDRSCTAGGELVRSPENGATASQSMTRSGVGRPRNRLGPSRRSSVFRLTSSPTSRNCPATGARYRSAARMTCTAVQVHHLVVEHVLGQHHLTGPAHELAQIEPGRPQVHGLVIDAVHCFDGQEAVAGSDPQQQAGQRRVTVLALHPGHQVDELADPLPALVEHGRSDQAGHADDGLLDRPAGGQAGITATQGIGGRCHQPARRRRNHRGLHSMRTPACGSVHRRREPGRRAARAVGDGTVLGG